MIDSFCFTKVLEVKPGYLQMTFSPRLGVAEISTHYPLLVKMSISIVSSPDYQGLD